MLTVDASVWVAAADRSDRFCAMSRQFLAAVAQQNLRLYLPSFAWLEIACALARRRQDAANGQRLADMVMTSPHIVRVRLDGPLMERALHTGPHALLRGADALYAATAALYSAQLISWDDELMRRAGAVTPSDWLAADS
jgi:predicted nucleic acid-binding protein